VERTRILVRDDGSLKVTGDVEIVDVEGRAWPLEAGKPVFLCRCGHSERKPFCDGSHASSGFRSCARAMPSEAQPG
jgi:hypothetical protein